MKRAPVSLSSFHPLQIPGWVLVRNQDVKGYDLKADGKGFYEVCGEPATVAIKCNEVRTQVQDAGSK